MGRLKEQILFFIIKLSCLYFSPSMYPFGVYSVQCKEPGDLGSFCQIKYELNSLTYFSSDPLVQ